MKKPPLNFVIDLKVYPFEIMVSIGETDQVFESRVKKHCMREAWPELETLIKLPDNCQGRCVHTVVGRYTIIRLAERPQVAKDHGYIAHEVFHAVHFIFHDIGLPLSLDSCEAYSYMIDYVTSEIYTRL